MAFGGPVKKWWKKKLGDNFESDTFESLDIPAKVVIEIAGTFVRIFLSPSK